MTPATLHHITIQTGHTRVSPREEVGAEAIAALRPLLSRGRAPIPGQPGYDLVRIDGPGYIGAVYAGREPLVTFGVARTEAEAEAVWAVLRDLSSPSIAAVPVRMPTRPAAPWLGVVLHVGLHLGVNDHVPALSWLGDLERCVAWTWILHGGGA